MSTGVTPFYYPEQPDPSFQLQLEDSYFLVKLHDTQAFFEVDWLRNPLNKLSYLTLSSSIKSSFKENFSTESLHKISTIQNNIPCRLGIGSNLTEWLPVRASGSLEIQITYTALQDTPIKNLIAQIEPADLIAKLSLKPDLAVALKVSKFVGKLLSYLVQEGKQHQIFSLTSTLNIHELKTGYYVAIGSHKDEDLPSPQFLQIDKDGRLRDKSAESLLSRLSYVVIEVQGISKLGAESFREQPWWELLTTAKNIISNTPFDSESDRRKLNNEWLVTLKYVQTLASQQKSEVLKSEIQGVIASAQVEVDNKLKPQTIAESTRGDELQDELQDILGIETKQELQDLARNYQEALKISQQLLKQYNLSGD
ncbi:MULTISPECIES: hypothetical protein [Calothrix]|uniref:Uncharacterized protein n=2 Tax=Calothrix TaxID=1186 RepID=A0ABR8AIS4_9CYAN|nr:MULTISPECIES: hypothetical protein [Calothrix]MBD2199425.1 hypothetical protein [Calothrix parietina FACHB-288]MBD2228226.1 hypothetical protein [Calothrix anomala FACHB-343]